MAIFLIILMLRIETMLQALISTEIIKLPFQKVEFKFYSQLNDFELNKLPSQVIEFYNYNMHKRANRYSPKPIPNRNKTKKNLLIV